MANIVIVMIFVFNVDALYNSKLKYIKRFHNLEKFLNSNLIVFNDDDSQNKMIQKDVESMESLNDYKSRFSNVARLYDNDDALLNLYQSHVCVSSYFPTLES